MSGMAAATRGTGPHAGQRLVTAGAPLERARLALVMIHGRGGAPEDMVGLAHHLALPDVAVLAPQAAEQSWWPDSFLTPLEANEPEFGSGLSVISFLLDDLSDQGFDPARLARPFRAVAALSGGLVGTGEAGGAPRADLYDRTDKTFDYAGRLTDVPVLIGCHERDPHIPLAQVRESADVLRDMGAEVDANLAQHRTWYRRRRGKLAAQTVEHRMLSRASKDTMYRHQPWRRR